MTIKNISVIIPTYNEEKDISECLRSLEKQTYKDFEIIIVDDGSTDKTIEIIKNFKKVKLIRGEHKGPGVSRNLGSKKARRNILVFVDADMTFDKDYLKNLIKPILEDRTGKIIGTTHDYELVKNLNSVWSRCWGKVRVDYRDSNNKDKISNDAVIFRAIKKSEFLKMGGFNSKYGYADDQTFWFEHKVKPVVAKNTTCYHKNPETLKATYKQSRWIGASLNNFLLNIPLIKYLLPLFMVLISPIMILLISIKRIIKLKNISLTFPMFVFVTARYFGTIEGLSRKIYLEKNVK